MKQARFLLIIPILLLQQEASGQLWNKLNPLKKDAAASTPEMPSLSEAEIQTLRTDVSSLASERMEGRKAGSHGEQQAAEYIEKRMQSTGIVPPIGKSFRRPFKFAVGREVSPESKITVNNKTTLIPYEATPLSFSAATDDENYVLPNSEERNTIWLEPLYASAAEAQNPSFNWEKYTFEVANNAIERGATSVVFFDAYGSKYFPQFRKESAYDKALPIPVWAVTNKVYEEHIKNMRTIRPVSLVTKFRTEYGNSVNLAGYVNNGAKSTVIIAAHYDHKGTDGKNIYPGADDASGVAALLALAPKIRLAQFRNYNYLFMVFSGEEEEAAGSHAFVEERDFKGKSIAYMIDLGNIGRLDGDRSLTIAGLGTTPDFKGLVRNVANNFTIEGENLGKSSSDHKTFYNINVPFLYFSTGSNAATGTTNDVASTINFKGLADITNYVFNIVSAMEKQPMPVFTKTKDEPPPPPKPVPANPAMRPAADTDKAVAKTDKTSAGNSKETKAAKPSKEKPLKGKAAEVAALAAVSQPVAPKPTPVFKVSLGISPDLDYAEGGVRVASVSAGRTAAVAGMQEGDIIIQMRDMPVQTYDDYQEALAKFNKGNKTTIKVKRNGRVQSLSVTFQ